MAVVVAVFVCGLEAFSVTAEEAEAAEEEGVEDARRPEPVAHPSVA